MIGQLQFLEPEINAERGARKMSKYIGNYEVVSELGRGGMGVVYKAREESLQRFVAVKMLGSQLVDNESIAIRFMREARAVADLNHPNVVQVFRVDRHEDQPYFVMEYVEGESLKQLIRHENKLQPMRALQILKEVGNGLTAAHDKGVIHRDIKPENIMLTKYGGVKVVDFGIARVEEPGTRLTSTGMGLGTPSYISPEVCLSQDVDQRSDIFSMGVVLFEMLTGDIPFKSDSPFEMMTKVVEAKVPNIKALNPNVDDGIKQILAKMTAKRPKLRYQNCNELISDIEDYLAGRVPRWSKNMPLEENEALETEQKAAIEVGEDVDDPTAIETSTAATTPMPQRPAMQADADEATATVAIESGDRSLSQSQSQSESEPKAESGRARGWRVALVAMMMLLLAGSWYLFSGSERPLLAIFDSTPDPGVEVAPDATTQERANANDAVPRADTGTVQTAEPRDEQVAVVGGTGDEMDVAGEELRESGQDSRNERPTESSSMTSSNPDLESDASPDRIVVQPDASSGAALASVATANDAVPRADTGTVQTAESRDEQVALAGGTGDELDVAGEELRESDQESRNERATESSSMRSSNPDLESDASLDRIVAQPDASSGEALASLATAKPATGSVAESDAMPANPRIAVVAVGDVSVAGTVAWEIKRALGRASFDVMDEQLVEGLVYAESLAAMARKVREAGASVLVYADVVPAGERELQFYGRQESQYLARLEVRVVDLDMQRNLGPVVAEKLEYVALTADRKAREAAAPIARNVVKQLRGLRAARSGSGHG